MKKIGVFVLLGCLLFAVAPMQVEANRGGIGGFLVGCCFGLRTAGQYNEGKNLHFRDWGRIIPYVGGVFAIWDGIEGAQGQTLSDLRSSYGAQYF